MVLQSLLVVWMWLEKALVPVINFNKSNKDGFMKVKLL